MIFRLWQRAAFFERFARASLDAGIEILREIGKFPTLFSESGFGKRFFKLRSRNLEGFSKMLGHFPADFFKTGAVFHPDDRKIRLVIAFFGMQLFPLVRIAQKLARQHLVDMSMDSRRRNI